MAQELQTLHRMLNLLCLRSVGPGCKFVIVWGGGRLCVTSDTNSTSYRRASRGGGSAPGAGCATQLSTPCSVGVGLYMCEWLRVCCTGSRVGPPPEWQPRSDNFPESHRNGSRDVIFPDSYRPSVTLLGMFLIFIATQRRPRVVSLIQL